MSPRREERVDQVALIDDTGTSSTPASNLFKRAWWAIALRGVLAILLGIVMLAYPGLTMATFVTMLGGYVFLDGVVTLLAMTTAAQRGRSWAPYLVEGFLSIVVGVCAFMRPASALLFLVMLFAVRALVVGTIEITTGLSIRRATGRSPWLLWLAGVASLAFGLLLFGRPGVGVLALVWTAGLYAIIFGIMLDAEAFRLKGFTARRLVTT